MRHVVTNRHLPADSGDPIEVIAHEMEARRRAGVSAMRQAINDLQLLPTMHVLASGVQAGVDEAIVLLQAAEAEQRGVPANA